jgi:hypothetical protein
VIPTPGTTGEVVAFDGTAWTSQIVDRVKESGGTTLTLSDIDDTGMLVRDGTTIKGGIRAWNIASAKTVKASLCNTTAATAGQAQHSPVLELGGQFWVGAANTAERIGFQLVDDATYCKLSLLHSHDGGAYADRASFAFAATSATFTINSAVIGLGASGGVTTDRVTIASDVTPGAASRVTFTNTTAAAGSTAATIGNVPSGIAGACAGWIKFYVANTPAYFPYWTA